MSKGFDSSPRMTHHMASILLVLSDRREAAGNFVRAALAVLASAGMVDIVGGMAEITTYGRVHLPEAQTVLKRWDEKIAQQIPAHPW